MFALVFIVLFVYASADDISHLRPEEFKALKDNYLGIVNDPHNNSLEDVFSSQRALKILGIVPACNCDAIKEIPRGNIKSGVDLYYRDAMLYECGCMLNVNAMLESIRQQFNEEQAEDDDSIYELIKSPEVEDSLIGLCGWLLSTSSTQDDLFALAIGKLTLLLQSDGSFLSTLQTTSHSTFENTNEVMFALATTDNKSRRSVAAANNLRTAISLALFAGNASDVITANAHLYGLVYGSPKTTAAGNMNTATLVPCLVDLVRYAPTMRIQVESLFSINELLNIGDNEGNPLVYFEVRKSADNTSTATITADGSLLLTVDAYTAIGEKYTSFEGVEVLSISKLNAGHKKSLLNNDKEYSANIMRDGGSVDIIISLPALAGGVYSMLLSCAVSRHSAETDGKGQKLLSRLRFTVSNNYELGSIRIGKSSLKSPKSTDLMLMHREKTVLSPGDMEFKLQLDDVNREDVDLFHAKIVLLSQNTAAPTQVLLSLQYIDSSGSNRGGMKCTATPGEYSLLRIALKNPKAKGSKKNEYIYEISINIGKMFAEFPEPFPCSGAYRLLISVGDGAAKEAKIRDLGVVSIVLPSVEGKRLSKSSTSSSGASLYTVPLMYASDAAIGLLPEIECEIKGSEPPVPMWKYATFLCVLVLFLAIYLIRLFRTARVGVFFHIPNNSAVMLFLCGVWATPILFVLYWSGHSFFDFYSTLKYILMIGLVFAFFGSRYCADKNSVRFDNDDVRLTMAHDVKATSLSTSKKQD